jgi:hypothetical protein
MRRLKIASQIFLARANDYIFGPGLTFETKQENKDAGPKVMSNKMFIDIPEQEVG